jgi:hypothetical protein
VRRWLGWEDFVQLDPDRLGCGQRRPLVFFLFDLLYLDGEMIGTAPLRERKERLRQLLADTGSPLQFSDHQIVAGECLAPVVKSKPASTGTRECAIRDLRIKWSRVITGDKGQRSSPPSEMML